MGKDEQGVNISLKYHRYQVIPRVLCFVMHGENVLLLKGAPDKRIWANKYNGLGGHVERNEDVYAAAVREICEEAGLTANDISNPRLRGIVNIDAGSEAGIIMMFVFTAQALSSHITSSSEGALEWVPKDRLPISELVEDLPTLLPRVFSMCDDDTPFFAHYRYDDQDRLVITFSTHPPLEL